MRDALFCLAFVVVSACSLDHVVVATLEDTSAGAANTGAAPTGSGGSGGSAGSAGASVSVSSAGSLAVGGGAAESAAGRAAIAAGGSAERGMPPSLSGVAGIGGALLCSCLSQQQGAVCGTDGITYPTECGDADPCFPPGIDCWHACPCLDSELSAGASGSDPTSWFASDCMQDNPCPGDFVCMAFTNVDPDAQTICSTAN